jgi:hypothetical protein
VRPTYRLHTLFQTSVLSFLARHGLGRNLRVFT